MGTSRRLRTWASSSPRRASDAAASCASPAHSGEPAHEIDQRAPGLGPRALPAGARPEFGRHRREEVGALELRQRGALARQGPGEPPREQGDPARAHAERERRVGERRHPRRVDAEEVLVGPRPRRRRADGGGLRRGRGAGRRHPGRRRQRRHWCRHRGRRSPAQPLEALEQPREPPRRGGAPSPTPPPTPALEELAHRVARVHDQIAQLVGEARGPRPAPAPPCSSIRCTSKLTPEKPIMRGTRP